MDRKWMSRLMGIVLVSTVGCTSQPDESAPSLNAKHAAVNQTETNDIDGPFVLEKDFTQLALDDFQFFPKPKQGGEPVWTAGESDLLYCTGLQRGYAYTKKVYRNFTLRLDFRYPAVTADTDKPPNTGFLIYLPEEHKVWPASLEVQGRQDEIGQIKSNSRDLTVTASDNEQARMASRNPPGQWNSIEIISRDGALTAHLNGKQIAESEPNPIKFGLYWFAVGGI